MTWNDVTYEYGAAGTAAGLPVRIVDGSGELHLEYDALGNLTRETREIAIPNSNHALVFATDYIYDSWGRMRSMTYPDEEQVDYTYRWGGDLFSVRGTKGTDSYRYVDSIAYNALGQRAFIRYGNNTRATYAYDPLHRLTQLTSHDSLGNLMQDIAYGFDPAGNITGISNSAGAIGTLGGSYENKYQYDRLHRLAIADGTGGPGFLQDYLISPAGRPAVTNQQIGGDAAKRYYAYSDHSHPHAPRRIYVESAHPTLHDLRWDAAGNLGLVSTLDENSGELRSRFHLWTEDNRLHTVVDDRHHSYYAYDHAGERTLKITGQCEQLDVSAWVMHTATTLSKHTVYPSPHLVLTEHGYTKHYYAGAERLAARQGGGFGRSVLGGCPEFADKATILFDQSLQQAPRLATPPEPHLREEWHLDEVYDNLTKELFDLPEELVIHAEIKVDEFLQSMQNLAASEAEPDVYFYHSDHLGSASWITDKDGNPVQHLQYLPYGEPYINQRVSGYNERFTFTGKERDKETGYSYFGARYMDHELMTLWLSVDPLSDKYPSISPYAYCAWNPIRLVDPDGREIEFDPESKALIAEFKSNTEKAKANAQTTEQSNELQQALDELAILEGSDQLYHIEYGNTGNYRRKGVTDYDIENDRVRIVIAFDGKDGDFAHELKHAFQFEKGELSFDAQTGLGMKSLLYDITDEQAAYQRGAAYGKEIPKNLEWHEKSPLGKGAFYYPFLNYGDVQPPNIPGNKSRRIDAKMIHGLSISSNTIYRYEGKTYNNKK